jgi:copper ion binding protein
MTSTLIPTVGQKFSVSGMTCDHCVRAVTASLFELDGVTRVAVDLERGTVITESVETLSLDVVAAAIDEAGYELAA